VRQEVSDYQPPQAARAGTTEAMTVAATINISIAIVFINVTSLKSICLRGFYERSEK